MSDSRSPAFKIIYEDKDLLVCFKPAGLPTQTAGLGREDLVSLLKKYLAKKDGNKNPYLAVIHRLDQPVSGLLVFGKTKQAAAKLSRQLQDGFANKEYLALCEGCPREEEKTVVHYIRKNPQTKRAEVIDEKEFEVRDNDTVNYKIVNKKKNSTIPADNDYKKAILIYEIMKEYRDSTLLRIQLHTGRFHQIRAQFAAIGHPLLGDGKYGTVSSKELSAKKGIRTIALCAYRLVLVHPMTGKEICFELGKEELPEWCF